MQKTGAPYPRENGKKKYPRKKKPGGHTGGTASEEGMRILKKHAKYH